MFISLNYIYFGMECFEIETVRIVLASFCLFFPFFFFPLKLR